MLITYEAMVRGYMYVLFRFRLYFKAHRYLLTFSFYPDHARDRILCNIYLEIAWELCYYGDSVRTTLALQYPLRTIPYLIHDYTFPMIHGDMRAARLGEGS